MSEQMNRSFEEKGKPQLSEGLQERLKGKEDVELQALYRAIMNPWSKPQNEAVLKEIVADSTVMGVVLAQAKETLDNQSYKAFESTLNSLV